MKHVIMTIALWGFALAAGAQTPPAKPQNSVEIAASATGNYSGSAGVRERAGMDRNCLRETGSRINRIVPDRTSTPPSYLASRSAERNGKAETERCNNAIGRSYSREDLEGTGRGDLADALRALDPAIR